MVGREFSHLLAALMLTNACQRGAAFVRNMGKEDQREEMGGVAWQLDLCLLPQTPEQHEAEGLHIVGAQLVHKERPSESKGQVQCHFHLPSEPLDLQGCIQTKMSLQMFALTPAGPYLFAKRVRNGEELAPVTLHPTTLLHSSNTHCAPHQVFEVLNIFHLQGTHKRRILLGLAEWRGG